MPAIKGRSGGRNKKSAALHVVQGTFRPSRHADDATPDPPAGVPAPRALTGEARAEWDRMIARLQMVGTLSIVDDAALRRYVKLHAETEAIEATHVRLAVLSKRLLKETERLDGKDLVTAIAEIVGIEKLCARHLVQLRQGSMALRQWLIEFGLTPAARTRVQTVKRGAPAMDPGKARYLRGLTAK